MTAQPPRLPASDPATRVGVVCYDRSGNVDAILTAAVALLRVRNVAVGGLLQRSGERSPSGRSVMWVDDIATGRSIRLDRPRGPGARDCVLDPDALTQAACWLQASAESGVAVIVVNRFGYAEAEGGGLRAEIAAAICSGAAVLIAIRDSRLNDLDVFLGGFFSLLPAWPSEIADWAEQVAAIRQPVDVEGW